jgi:hypothetical protein
LKRFVILLLLSSIICTVGCATTKDLQRVHGDFDRQVSALKEEDAGIRHKLLCKRARQKCAQTSLN